MSGRELPGSLRQNPAIDRWISIHRDGTLTVRTGKVEIGQGIKTAIAMIAAEELDVAPGRIRVVSGITGTVVDEQVTSGSGSMEQSGRAMRQVAASARAFLLQRAAETLEVPESGLIIEDGIIRSPETNRQTSYWALMGDRRFDRDASPNDMPKPPEAYRLLGRRVADVDARAKVCGDAIFVHDLRLDGMLHARILRPPSYDARLISVETAPVEAMDGVLHVIRSGRFLAVIAETEWQALCARERLATLARWEEPALLPDEEQLYPWLLEHESAANPVIDGTTTTDPAPQIGPVPDEATATVEGYFGRPYHMHGSIGPSAAVARFAEGRLTVWSASQGPYPLRRALAPSLGLEEEAVQVIHTQGAGCYGHNGADDVALDAALLAMACEGRPVRVQWMREDEHRWEPYGPAMVVAIRASLDGTGRIIDWNHDVWSTTHQGRPRPTTATHSSLIADWHREPSRNRPEAKPALSRESGAHRNARPYYRLERSRIVSRLVTPTPLRTSSFRGLGNYANIFAIESTMDALAGEAGLDPLALRLAHLDDPRARAVLEAAAEAIGWPPPQAPSAHGRGIGLAFNRYKNGKAYAAVGCEVEVDEASGQIRVLRAVVAGDSGQVVNAAALANQLEGGVIQAFSWTLMERVRFDPVRITSDGWERYPILRFPQIPPVRVILINRPGAPFLGSGEGSQGPAGAALANAVARATGVRLRELPFTPERVRAMLVAARQERGTGSP